MPCKAQLIVWLCTYGLCALCTVVRVRVSMCVITIQQPACIMLIQLCVIVYILSNVTVLVQFSDCYIYM